MHFNVDNLVGEQYDDPVAPCVRYSMCRILMYNGIDNEGMECLAAPRRSGQGMGAPAGGVGQGIQKMKNLSVQNLAFHT